MNWLRLASLAIIAIDMVSVVIVDLFFNSPLPEALVAVEYAVDLPLVVLLLYWSFQQDGHVGETARQVVSELGGEDRP